MTVTLFRLFCMTLYELRFKDCRGAVTPQTIVYQTDFGFDFGCNFHLGMDESKMNMENLSAKLGDLHLSFKSKIEIPKCQIDTLE